jgi:hypothetical protein
MTNGGKYYKGEEEAKRRGRSNQRCRLIYHRILSKCLPMGEQWVSKSQSQHSQSMQTCWAGPHLHLRGISLINACITVQSS